ncbi:hypothetical protein EBR21_05935 [bacterium]|nr:hypothetical protein [bacterium]
MSHAHADFYLREQIHAKSMIPKFALFARVLDALALINCQQANVSSVSLVTGVQFRFLQKYVAIFLATSLLIFGHQARPLRTALLQATTFLTNIA